MTTWRFGIFGGAIRFVAGCCSAYAVWSLLTAIGGANAGGPARVLGVADLCLCLTAAYVVTIGLLRPSVHSAAGIESRRSFFTGMAAMCVLAIVDGIIEIASPGLGTLYSGHTSHLVTEALAFLVGGGSTYAGFSAWLSENEREAEETMDALDEIAAATPKGRARR